MRRPVAAILMLACILSLCSPGIAAEKKEDPVKTSPPTGENKRTPAKKVQLLDINTATEDQLKALPGVSEEHVKKIIANRPYAGKEELLSRDIIPGTVYELIKDRITAEIKAER